MFSLLLNLPHWKLSWEEQEERTVVPLYIPAPIKVKSLQTVQGPASWFRTAMSSARTWD